MIHPSQVRPVGAKPADHDRQIASLEASCDAAIECADRNQKWPAKVTSPRTRYPSAVVDEVIGKYRLAGWTVARRDGTYVLIIDRPEAT